MMNSIGNKLKRRRAILSIFMMILGVFIVVAATFTGIRAATTKPAPNVDITETVPLEYLDFVTIDEPTPDGYDGEAIFIGLKDTIPSVKTLKGQTLVIPNEIEISSLNYKVTKVDTALGTDFSKIFIEESGKKYYYTSLQYYGSYIEGLILKDGIKEINPGAFYGMASLKYYKAPFVGLNSSDNVNPLHIAFSRGAFSAINTYDDIADYNNLTDNDKEIIRYGISADDNIGTHTYQPKYFQIDSSPQNKVSTQIEWPIDPNIESGYSYFFELPTNLAMVEITGGFNFGDNTFFHIESLETVILPDSLLTVGMYCFANCTNLTSVIIPNKMSSLGVGMFSGCINLPEVIIPAGTTDIPDSMFFNCTNLGTVKMPQSVQNIAKLAFAGCNNLHVELFNDDPEQSESSDSQAVLLPNGLKTIGQQAFENVYTIEKIVIKNALQRIDSGAFMNCYNLGDITVPFIGNMRGKQTDGEGSLEQGLNNFGYILGKANTTANLYSAIQNGFTYSIPKKLRTISVTDETYVEKGVLSNLFDPNSTYTIMVDGVEETHFNGVTTISIKGNVSKVEAEALAGTNELNSLTVPLLPGENRDSRNAVGRLFFVSGGASASNYSTENTYTAKQHDVTYVMPDNLSYFSLASQDYILSGTFHNTKFEVVEIGTDTVRIYDNIFFNNQNLTSITLPFVGYERNEKYERWWWWYDYMQYNLCSWVFSYQYSENTYEDRSIAYFDSYVRKVPSTLTSITITDEKKIGTYAFRNLKSLTNLTIKDGGSLESIAQSACVGCSGLKTMTLPWIGEVKNTEGVNGQSHTLGWIFGPNAYMDKKSYSAYQGYNYNNIPLGLESITIDYVTRIPNYAFANINTLKNVEFKTKVTQVGVASFLNNKNLSSIIYTSDTKFTVVENSAFSGCTKMNYIEDMIPEYKPDRTIANLGNIRIGASALAYTSVSEINFYNFTDIGDYAFQGLLNLENVDVTANLSSFGKGVFADCTFLKTVTLANNINLVTPALFRNCTSLEGIDLTEAIIKDENNQYVIPEEIFYNCSSLTWANLKLPDTVTYIGDLAFAYCDSLEMFNVPSNTVEICKAAFLGCTSLQEVTIPKKTMIVGSSLFSKNIGNGFVIWVYYKENESPRNKWPEGWNCANPVKVYPGDDDSIYKFGDVNSSLGGYEIIGFKDGLDLTVIKGELILPRTHNGVPVVGIRSGVFDEIYDASSTDLVKGPTKIIIPESFKVVGCGYGTIKGAFDNGHRIDLYFESNDVCSYNTSNNNEVESSGINIFSDTVNNPVNRLVTSGLVFKAGTWEYGTGADSTTPYVKLSSLKYTLKNVNLYFTGNPQTKDVTKVQLPCEVVGGEITKDVATTMFNYAYKDNILAGTAKINISLGAQYYTTYISQTATNPYLVLFAGTATVDFTIEKQVIELFYNEDNEDDYCTYYGYGVTPIKYNSTSPWSFEGEWNGYATINGQPFTEEYSFTGKIATSSNNAGFYESDGEPDSSDFVWAKAWRVYYKNKNVTDNYKIVVYLKVRISPMDVTITFEEKTVQKNGITYIYNERQKVANDGWLEVEYTGEDITPTAIAVDANGKVIDECVIEVTRTNDVTTMYPAYTYGDLNYAANINEATAHVSSTTQNYVATNAPYTIDYRVVKANVRITLVNDEWLIPYDEEGYSNEQWDTGDISITGLSEYSKLAGRIENIGINDAPRNAKGTYTANSDDPTSNDTIVWIPKTFDLLPTGIAYHGDYNPKLNFLIYREELVGEELKTTRIENDYYNILLNASITLVWNDFTRDYYIGDEKLTLADNGTHEDKDKVVWIDYNATYHCDGTTNYFGVKVTNTGISDESITIKYLYNNENHDKDDKLAINAITVYNVGIMISRKNFNSVYDAININSVKCDVEYLDLNKEYDGIPATLEGFITRKGHNPEQEIQLSFTDRDHNALPSAPLYPGEYCVHIIAKEHGFFNELDYYYNFDISKKTLKIYVDHANAEGAYYLNNSSVLNPSKIYDESPYVIVIDTSYLPAEERIGLVGDDNLQGILRTRSQTPGIYDTATLQDKDKENDWIWQGGWNVIDVSKATNNSQYYNVVLYNSFEIKKKNIEYTVDDYDLGNKINYDGGYYSISINVTTPTSGYTIMYTDVEPVKQVDEETGEITYVANWRKTNFYYASPGEYQVWYKIEAPNYNTVCESAKIIILTDHITFEKPEDIYEKTAGSYIVDYTGLDHFLEVLDVTPIITKVEYSLYRFENDNQVPVLDEDGKPYVNTTKVPSIGEGERTDVIGKYRLYVKLSAMDYPTEEAEWVFELTDAELEDISSYVDIDGLTKDYNADKTWTPKHEVLSSFPGDPADVKFYFRNNSNEKWSTIVPSYKNACDSTTIQVLAWAPGYKAYIKSITITINKINMSGISAESYNGIYDALPHSISINGTCILDDDFALPLIYSDAEIYYSAGNDILLNKWTTVAPSRTDYGITEVHVRIEKENYNDFEITNTKVEIIQNPMDKEDSFVYEDGMEIEYLGKEVSYDDLNITTIHDGKRTVEFYFGVLKAGKIVKDDSNTTKAHPQELGYYYVVINYKQSPNCAAKKIQFGFQIVPRKLEIKYKNVGIIEEEYGHAKVEYNSVAQSPLPYVESGTGDVLLIDKYRMDTTEDPTDLGVYYYNYTFKYPQTNYVIVQPSSPTYTDYPFVFEITKIKLDIVIPSDSEYAVHYYNFNTPTIWEMEDNFDKLPFHSKILNGHNFSARFFTNNYTVGTYVYTDSLITNKILLDYLYIVDKDGKDVSGFYDINLYDLTIEIAYPKLNLTYDEVVEIEYDSNDHTIEIEVEDSMKGLVSFKYATEDMKKENNWSYTPLYYKDVGIYTVHFIATSYYSSPYEGTVTIKIVPATFYIDIDDLEETYDAGTHNITYSLENQSGNEVNNLPAGSAEIRYYDASLYTELQVEAFYNNYDKTQAIYQSSYAKLVDAGHYYAVVYFEESDNWHESYSSPKYITINQKTIDVDLGLSSIYSKSKDYDGEYFIVNLGKKATIDETDLCVNHKFVPSLATSMVSAKLRTDSANAGVYVGPTGFQFLEGSIFIKSGTEDVTKNYKPVLAENKVEITINKIDVDLFEAEDLIKQYDGLPANPTIITNSDGLITYQYYPVIDGVTSSKAVTAKQASQIGVYDVYCDMGEGTNYNSYKGSPVYARVTIIPREVTVVWENLEQTFTGSGLIPTAYFVNENGENVPVTVEVFAYGKFMPSALYANQYMCYATYSESDSGNYNLNNFSAIFKINPLKYTFNINDTTDNDTTPWSILFDSSNIGLKLGDGIFVIGYKQSGLVFTNMRLTKAEFNNVSSYSQAKLLTYSKNAGSYYLKEHFNFSNIYVYTADGINVYNSENENIDSANNDKTRNNSIEFDINGKVVIESSSIIVEQLIESVEFKEKKEYNIIGDIIRIKSPVNMEATWHLSKTSDFEIDDVTQKEGNAGTYTYYYKVIIEGYPTAEGHITFTITPKESFINIVKSLDKTYNGEAYTADDVKNSISGDFNRSSDVSEKSDLVITFTKYGSTTPITKPMDAGVYMVNVKSAADAISDITKNYTELDFDFSFEIKAKTVRLVINEEIEVSDADFSSTYEGEEKSLSNKSGISSYNVLAYSFESEQEMARGTYTYSGIVDYIYGQSYFNFKAHNSLDNKDYDYIFNWVVYSTNRPDEAAVAPAVYQYTVDSTLYLNVSYNYAFDLDYTLVIRYPIMDITIDDVDVDYDGTPKYSSIKYNSNPTASEVLNLTPKYNFGYKVDGNYTASSISGVTRTLPGQTDVIYMIECDGYEPLVGIYTINIKYDKRIIDNKLKFDKEYDGQAVDGTIVLGWLTYTETSSLTEDQFYSSSEQLYAKLATSNTYVKVGYNPNTTYYKHNGAAYVAVDVADLDEFKNYENTKKELYIRVEDNVYEQANYLAGKTYYIATSDKANANILISLGKSGQPDDKTIVPTINFYRKGSATPMPSNPVDAGMYYYTVTIPGSEYYAETVIEGGDFTISQKRIYLDGTKTHNFNGNVAKFYGISLTDADLTYYFADGTLVDPTKYEITGLNIKTNDSAVSSYDETTGTYTDSYSASATSVTRFTEYSSSSYKVFMYIGGVKTDITRNVTVSLHSNKDTDGTFKNFDTHIVIQRGAIGAYGEDITFNYDGQYHTAKVLGYGSVPNVTIKYSFSSNSGFVAPGNDHTFEFVNVKRDPDTITKILPYVFYAQVSAPNYVTEVVELRCTIIPAETTIKIIAFEGEDTVDYYSDYYGDKLVSNFTGRDILIPGTVTINHNEVELSDFVYSYREWDGSTYKVCLVSGADEYNDIKEKLYTFDGNKYNKVIGNYDSTATYYERHYEDIPTRKKDAGWYQVIVTVPSPDNGNYTSAQGIFTYRIMPAEAELVWTNRDLTYNGLKQVPTVSFTKLPADTDTIKIVPKYYKVGESTEVDPIDVGTYTVSIILENDSGEEIDNYVFKESQKTVSFNINQKPIVIRLNAIETYTGSGFTYTYDETGVGGIGLFTADGICKTADSVYPKVDHYVASSISTSNSAVAYYGQMSYSNTTEKGYLLWNSSDLQIKILDKLNSDADVSANYKVEYDAWVNINYSTLKTSIKNYSDYYDTKYHGVEVSFDNSFIAGETPVIYYCDTYDGTYTTAKSDYMYKDSGYYKVYIKIKCDGFDDIVPFDANDFHYVEIKKLNANLDFEDPGIILSKVYDGMVVPNPKMTFNTEKLTVSALHFDYYIKGDGSYTEKAPGNQAIAAGDYKLVVSLGEDDNYEQASLERYFTISKRPVTITYTGILTKVYDGYRWSVDLANLPVNSLVKYDTYLDNKDKGLALGHTFYNSVLQTITNSSKTYDKVTDFEWQSETYHILDSKSNDVSENYDLVYTLSVKITKANFVVKSSDYEGTYDGEEHTINVDVIVPTKKIYKILYSLNNDAGAIYTETPVYKKEVGVYTVYFKVVDDSGNYDTYSWSAQIIIDGLESDGTTTNPGQVIYGNDYENPMFIDAGGYIREQEITYYEYTDYAFDNPLGKPTNAGHYRFKILVKSDGVYKEDTVKGEFVIVPRPVTVKWDNSLALAYTGEYQKPTAYIKDSKLIDDYSSETVYLDIDLKYSKRDVGSGYEVKVTFADGNYKLENNETTFAIVKKGIDVPDLATGMGFTYYFEVGEDKFGDKVIFTDKDGKKYILDSDNMTIKKVGLVEVELPYHFELDKNPNADHIVDGKMTSHKLTVVLGNYLKVGYDENKQYYKFNSDTCTYEKVTLLDQDEFNDYSETLYYKFADSYVIANYKLGIKYYKYDTENKEYVEVDDVSEENFYTYEEQLYSYVNSDNYVWNVKATSNPQYFEYQINPYVLPYAEEDTKVLAQLSAYAYEYMDGEEITPIPEVIFRKGSNNIFTMEEGVHYEISYDNNKDINEDSTDKAIVKVTGIGNFMFKENVKFTIKSKIDPLFALKEGSVAKFVEAKQNEYGDILYDESDDYERTMDNKSDEDGNMISYISHIHQETSISDLLDQFESEKSLIRVFDINGNEILDVDNNFDYTYVGTGMQFKLYAKAGDEEPIDVIEAIVFGDLNGDGTINATDALLYKNINGGKLTLDDLNSGAWESKETYVNNGFIKLSCYYASIVDRESGYTKPNAAMALMLKLYNAGKGSDFNLEYKI